jgi:glycosyltransferase involved in cell wall biosynthesis
MLSVLLATHNGADTIDRTLAAMSKLDAPEGGWKLVIVNNASTDDTESRILKWRELLPLEYVIEPKLGKSNALNTGFAHAEGDFIVMTDDDVLPDRQWLTEWRRVADAWPEISVFSGAIIPEFDGGRPQWPLSESSFTALYGMTPARAEGRIEPINVAGANLAVRQSVIGNGSRFGEGFLVGANGLMGEDSDFVARLSAEGHAVGFAPTAKVGHIVHRHQTSWHWIHRRFFRHSRSIFMAEDVRRDEATKRYLVRYPWWRIRKAARLAACLLAAAVSFDKNRILRQSQPLAYHLGALWQASVLLRRK